MAEKEAIERMKRDYELAKSEDSIDIDIFTEDIRIVLNLIQTQQKEIEKVSSEFAIGKRQYEQLIDDYDELNFKNINLQKEVEKKDTLINTMQAEFERLENLEDNTDMLKEELKKKDKIIDNSINEIEKIRQYFSEDLQVEFIRILEILKDKKVIDW